MIPVADVIPSRTRPWITILLIASIAIFVHAGWLYAGSNLLVLWIFGSTIEDRLGHGRYLVLLLLAGTAGHFAQTAASPTPPLLIVVTTGAIAGVMGAYVVRFPHSRVLVLIPLPIIFDVIEVPALVFLGLWAAFQFASGAPLWAMGGGLLTGVAGVFAFRRRERDRVEWWS